MKEPVDHILRPRLPWRTDEGAMTECGYNAASVKAISRDEYAARVKDMGRQRAAILTCMTCSQTAGRHKPWSEDPRSAIEREVQWEAPYYGKERGERLKDELLAIEALVAAHPEEFQRMLTDMASRRQWNERKARESPPKKPRVAAWD
jgi:hypothetical protein